MLQKIILSLLLISQSAFAAKTVKLDMQLEVDGVVISHPIQTVNLGEKSTFVQETQKGTASYVLEVTPTQNKDQSVAMNFEIHKISDGQAKLWSNPRIIDLSGETASVETENDKSKVKLSVTPTL